MENKQLNLLDEFEKFIAASATGRRLLSSGKKIRKGTIEQYKCVQLLMKEFEQQQEPLRIQILTRCSTREIQKEKNIGFDSLKTSPFFYLSKRNTLINMRVPSSK